MKPYIYNLFFLFITLISYSQTKEVILNKTFSADENTILNLDLDNATIVLEESFDGKVHFDYTIIFGRYSKRKREEILKQMKTKVTKKSNLINLVADNTMFFGINHESKITLDSLETAVFSYLKSEKLNKYKYKTKDSLINEIKVSNGSNLTDFLANKKIDYENNKVLKGTKMFVKIFIVKVPKNVQVRLKALHSNVTFNYNVTQPLILNSFKGTFKFRKILSNENRIISSNGIFQAEKIENGRIEFLDMSKVLVGEISNINLATETSKIEIGEIGQNVIFNDFNSKIYLYNFANHFKKFHLKGDYSKLNLYKVKETNFSMDVSGFNTTLNMDGKKTSFGAPKEKEHNKILEKKRKENSPFLGNINIALKNGILNIK